MNVLKQTFPVAFVFAGAVLACVSAQAAPQACGAVSPAERRIVERANGDVASLRTFVGMTAVVYGVNMVDVRENLDQWRAAVECHRQAAAAEQAERDAVAKQDDPADPALVVARR